MEEKKILDSSKYYSKTLKAIDAKLKFHNEEKENNIENIKKEIILKRKENRLKYIKNIRHESVIYNLKKFEIEAKKNMEDKMKGISLTSAINKIISLPRVDKYKKEIKDDRKNNENNLIKFEKIWREQCLNDVKNKKKVNKNKLILDGIFYNDIFDINYDKYRKNVETRKEKNKRMERIKSNNLKVSKKLKNHRELMLKILDHREYKPNYSSIEKHKPVVKLGTKSTRLFLKNINNMTAPNIRRSNDKNNNKNNSKSNILSYFSKYKNNLGNIIILNNSQKNITENNDKIKKMIISLSALNFKLKTNNSNISTNFDNNNYILDNKRNKRRNIINICGTSWISDISNLS